MNKFNVAIDGVSGVGKSTLAKLIASEFNLVFINTGQMYRAIAYHFISIKKLNYDFINQNLSKQIKILKPLADQKIQLNDQEVSSFLWTDEISKAASFVAKNENVRKFCVSIQKELAKNKNIVMEGRDIGSVVLPDAEVKFFLVANSLIRAKRRIKQLKEKNIKFVKEDILKNIEQRDRDDQSREIDPLVQVEDAILVDTSNYTLDEVKNILFKKIREKISHE